MGFNFFLYLVMDTTWDFGQISVSWMRRGRWGRADPVRMSTESGGSGCSYQGGCLRVVVEGVVRDVCKYTFLG